MLTLFIVLLKAERAIRPHDGVWLSLSDLLLPRRKTQIRCLHGPPRNVGYLVHPKVIATLPSGARVSDIGTGTGRFLERFQSLYGSTGLVLDGYDISGAMFPSSTLPNITLTELDIKKPVPQELHGKYDLVHVRMIVAGMLPNEWPAAVANVAQLLKPGGWLQWVECDMIGTKHVRSAVDSTVETARAASKMFRDAFRERFEHGWNNLPDDMRAAGLTFIITDCASTDRLPETRERQTANGMKAIFAWMRKTGAMEGEALEVAEKQANADIKSGCYCRFEIHVICGQKPL